LAQTIRLIGQQEFDAISYYDKEVVRKMGPRIQILATNKLNKAIEKASREQEMWWRRRFCCPLSRAPEEAPEDPEDFEPESHPPSDTEEDVGTGDSEDKINNKDPKIENVLVEFQDDQQTSYIQDTIAKQARRRALKKVSRARAGVPSGCSAAGCPLPSALCPLPSARPPPLLPLPHHRLLLGGLLRHRLARAQGGLQQGRRRQEEAEETGIGS
jgi:hypothetical protein